MQRLPDLGITPGLGPRGVFRTVRRLPYLGRRRLGAALRAGDDRAFQVVVFALTFRANMLGPTVHRVHDIDFLR